MQGISRVTMSQTEFKMHPQSICKANLDKDADNIQVCYANVLWVAFLIPSGSLSLVKYLAH
jgi:hypothetical protein